MVAMRYYGNVMTTTMSQYSDDVIYFCCWRCVYWACYTCILHLQQYSHRLNLLYFFCSPVTFRLDPGTRPPLTWLHDHRHTKFGRTPLYEWSSRRRDDLTTHNTHKKQTSMLSAGFEPTVPASQRSQTHALDRAATATGKLHLGFRNVQHQVTSDFTWSTTNMEDTMLAGIGSANLI